MAARHVDALTGVRALAAGWVLAFHLWLAAGRHALPVGAFDPSYLLASGWLGVDIFFALSGFVLCWQALADRDAGRPRYQDGVFWRDWRAFMARRALRVFPAYLFCLSILLAVIWHSPIAQNPAFGSVVLHALMLHSFWWQLDINGVFWSLPVEWEFYLAFPLLMVLAYRRQHRLLGASALIVTVTLKAWALHRGWMGNEGSHFPWRMDRFVAGMLGAAIARRPIDATRRAAFAWTGLACLLAYGYLAGEHGITSWSPDLQPFLRDAWLNLSIPLLLIGVSGPSNVVQRILACRPAVFVGTISYSLYLFHYPLLFATYPRLSAAYGPVVASLGFVGITIAVSCLSYRFVERPFLDAPGRGARRARMAALAVWIAIIPTVASWYAAMPW